MNPKNRSNPTEPEEPQCRTAFLLRLWCEEPTGHANWRASLELPGTGKKIGFASLEQLFIYLADWTESQIKE